MSDLGKCCKQVYGTDRFSSFHGHPCDRKAKVIRDGKSYCGMHDPVAVEEKDRARLAKWDAERKEKEARWNEQDKRRKAIDALCGHIPTDELANYELVRKPRPVTPAET